MSVYYDCPVLPGKDTCVGLIPRPEESYRIWCECDREASTMRRSWPNRGCCAVGGGGGGIDRLNFKVLYQHLAG